MAFATRIRSTGTNFTRFFPEHPREFTKPAAAQTCTGTAAGLARNIVKFFTNLDNVMTEISRTRLAGRSKTSNHGAANDVTSLTFTRDQPVRKGSVEFRDGSTRRRIERRIPGAKPCASTKCSTPSATPPRSFRAKTSRRNETHGGPRTVRAKVGLSRISGRNDSRTRRLNHVPRSAAVTQRDVPALENATRQPWTGCRNPVRIP